MPQTEVPIKRQPQQPQTAPAAQDAKEKPLDCLDCHFAGCLARRPDPDRSITFSRHLRLGLPSACFSPFPLACEPRPVQTTSSFSLRSPRLRLSKRAPFGDTYTYVRLHTRQGSLDAVPGGTIRAHSPPGVNVTRLSQTTEQQRAVLSCIVALLPS